MGIKPVAVPTNLQEKLAIVCAGYAKRLLDTHAYDRLFDSHLGRRLKRLPPVGKYLAELGLHVSNIFVDSSFDSEKPFQRFVSDVLTDMPAETAKRIINGDESPASGSVRPMIEQVLDLSEDDIARLAKWLESASDAEVDALGAEIRELGASHLAKLVALEPAARAAVLKFTKPDEGPSERPPPGPSAVESVANDLSDRLEARRAERRRRRSAR